MGQGPSEWLACPSCGGAPLVREPRQWRCAGCSLRFDDFGSIPCLLVDRAAHQSRWCAQAAAFDAMVERVLQRVKQDLARFDLLPRTRRRLNNFAKGSAGNRAVVLELLASAGVQAGAVSTPDEAQVEAEIHGARGRLPLTHHYELLLRDWAWADHGNEENAEALARITAVVGANDSLGRTLILGPGAGRLAYDLHTMAETTVALDLDPLLSLAAQKVLFGDGLELHELPLTPDASVDSAVARQLRRPGPSPETLHWVVGDARQPPFAPGSFDTVVTPWFLDVVELGVRDVVGIVHRLLAPGGRWINTGPLLYPESHGPAERFAPDEVCELVELGGFEIQARQLQEARYLRSPVSGHGRLETLLDFAAIRRATLESIADPGGVVPWIVMPHLPVRLPESARDRDPGHPLLRRAQALVDGKRSLDAIAKALREEGALPPDVSERDATGALLSKLLQG